MSILAEKEGTGGYSVLLEPSSCGRPHVAHLTFAFRNPIIALLHLELSATTRAPATRWPRHLLPLARHGVLLPSSRHLRGIGVCGSHWVPGARWVRLVEAGLVRSPRGVPANGSSRLGLKSIQPAGPCHCDRCASRCPHRPPAAATALASVLQLDIGVEGRA